MEIGIQSDEHSCGMHMLDWLLQKMRQKDYYEAHTDDEMTIWRARVLSDAYKHIQWHYEINDSVANR